ncbi:MAG: phosphoglucomutase/phosphomannomutase family protein [Rhodothermia bacterium]|nr:MAG: phosphoglucomutase/phosphomannomutase family protein [Rhodothermia bacterium]
MSHPDSDIRFGTDGWRAVIGEAFTLPNVTRVAAATVSWVIETYGPESSVVIGHDPRSLGVEAARMVARVMASQGIHVYFGDNITPTPAISWATKEYGCSAGIVLTASHNPSEYNGFKIKGHFGGSALPEMIEDIEGRIPPSTYDGSHILSFESYLDQGQIEYRAVRSDYISVLMTRLNLDLIRDSGMRIVHDAMYGAGRGIFTELLGADSVVEIHSIVDPSFGGTPPEPIEANLTDLPARVISEACSAGIANDGDADRIGMCDENGRFVDSHKLLALLVQYLHEDRGLDGDIVKTFSTTDMLDAMGKSYGLNVLTTPIGFKYIGGYFLDGNVLVGGEESGGIAVSGHIPERDGVYVGALVLEMMAHRNSKLSELVDALSREYGPHAYFRVDKHTSVDAKESALKILEDSGGLSEINGSRVTSLEMLDGFKHRMQEGWLLVRPSGTEPVLRIYSEAPSPDQAEANVMDAVRQLGI